MLRRRGLGKGGVWGSGSGESEEEVQETDSTCFLWPVPPVSPPVRKGSLLSPQELCAAV